MNSVTLLPIDIYQVVNKSLLSENDKLILTMLYMPIIGNQSITLYNTLYNELKMNSFVSKESTHKHLMTSLGETLETIKDARIKLEGIGLLKTYVMEGSINSYVYELYSPLSANEFFNHPIFNMVLYNNLGSNEYNKVKSYFKVPKLDLKGYTEITTPFDMTFKSKGYTNYDINSDDIAKKTKLTLNYKNTFDFDTFLSNIPVSLINKNALTPSVKELINNLSFLYKLDPFIMSDLVKISLNEKGLIEKEELKKNIRRYYEFNNNGKKPSLIYKNQPTELRSENTKNTHMNKMIKVFETTPPKEFLKSKYKGVNPTRKDMEILELLLVDLKFTPAVCNVLIDYVLKTQDNRLIKSYIEVIAGEWKRANLETAKEAMEYAESTHKKFKKIKEKKLETKKEEKVPEWFGKKQESEKMSETETEELSKFLKEFV